MFAGASFGNRSLVLSEAGTDALALCILKNTSLENLSIDVTRIPADGTLRILNALAYNDTLMDVNLSGMEGNGQVLAAIARLVQQNDTITTLGLNRPVTLQ